jgi:Zinc-finger associated domain (zf-AD)
MEPRCRICLEPNSLLDIFSPTDITPTLQEIEESTGIHITATSRLPKFLCLNCICEITNAYQLRVKARCSDARLREIYTSNESNEIMPVVKVERKRERSSSNESNRSYLDATPTINEGRPKKEKLSADWRVADNDAKVTIRKVQKSNFHEEVVVALPRKSGSPPKVHRKVNMATIKKTRTKSAVPPPKPVKIVRPPVEPRERPTKFEAICEICAKLLTCK